MTQTSARLLELLALLQTRREWSGRDLAERLGVSGRTIRRDVERLRELGYPVDAHTGPNGGYRLRAGTAMPPLLLDDDEAVAIAVGLRSATAAPVTGMEETAVRALVKLEQVLPSHLRRRVTALRAATAARAAPGPTFDAEVLTTLAAACRDRERVRFAYRSRDGTATQRRVEPHSLVNLGQRWYLVAWDCDRGDWRTFRLDRLARPAPAGTRFVARELPGGDAAAFVADRMRDADYRYRAAVTLHAPAEEIARRHPWLRDWLQPLDGRRSRLRVSDDSLDWLALRIAGLGCDFVVHEPPELAERCRQLGERLARAATGIDAGWEPSPPATG